MKTASNKRLLIGVDGNEANIDNRVGINTYAFETLLAIQRLEPTWQDEITFEIILKEKPKAHMPKETRHFKYLILGGSGMWIIKVLTPYLLKNVRKYDVFWTPSHYVPPISLTPRVCSIMDLGYLTSKNQFRAYDYWQLKIWTIISLLVCRKVISISNATKNDLINHYPFAAHKISTTLLGYDESRYNRYVPKSTIMKVREKYHIPEKYVLFLSTLKPSKNIEGLIKAWGLIYRKYPGTKLVIAGKKGWLFDSIFDVVKKLSLESEVIFTDFFEEDEKPALIAGAKVFVLPSFWEGFGLDLLSSMACGVPLVVSDRGSLPEVVAEAGVVINPDKIDSIASGIDKILSATRSQYMGYVNQGLKRVKDFSWEKTAQETINVLKLAT